MDNRINAMAKALKDPSIALLKYNKLRGRHSEGLVFAFEGYDDPNFYVTIAQRCNFNHIFHILVVDGKDMVLGLRDLLSASSEASMGDGVAFFVDADFDGLKGKAPGSDIYITPTYSIENIVVQPKSLESLLKLEFRLYEDELEDDLEQILLLYDEVMLNFQNAMRTVNQVIFFGRTTSSDICDCTIKSIDDSSEKFFRFDKSTLQTSIVCNGDKVKEVVRFTKDFDLSLLSTLDENFDRLDPLLHWRGKFFFSVFKQFVAALIEDRNSSSPKYFTKGKGKVKLNIGSDSAFRLLATACDVPPCLAGFFALLPGSSLH